MRSAFPLSLLFVVLRCQNISTIHHGSGCIVSEKRKNTLNPNCIRLKLWTICCIYMSSIDIDDRKIAATQTLYIISRHWTDCHGEQRSKINDVSESKLEREHPKSSRRRKKKVRNKITLLPNCIFIAHPSADDRRQIDHAAEDKWMHEERKPNEKKRHSHPTKIRPRDQRETKKIGTATPFDV